MGNHTPITPAGRYHLVVDKPPIAPVMFKAILESWCHLNCVGDWQVDIITLGEDDAPERLSLDLNDDDDMVLLMLSSEYTYMGRPPINH